MFRLAVRCISNRVITITPGSETRLRRMSGAGDQTLSGLRGRLHVEPPSTLVDETTHYSASGLDKGADVTIAAVLREGPATFVSHAHYTADTAGRVDVTTQPASGGSYKGVEPMGLMWAMKPQAGARPGERLFKRDVTTPVDITLYLMAGHRDIQTSSDVADVLCQVDHPRTYMAPGVTRIPVRDGRLRGALFLPKGSGPFPGVLDMFGGIGGLVEYRGALLASRGFASFALAYFRYEGLSDILSYDMEYFEEAVDWLVSHPSVRSEGVGAIGTSKGAEIAHYMAIARPEVVAVVSINGWHTYSIGYQYRKGVLQPVTCPDWKDMVETSEGLVLREAGWKCSVKNEDAVIKIEEAERARFLFINGDDDQNIAPGHAEILTDRLKRSGKSNYERLCYPGAGHLIEPPYTPHTRTAYNPSAGQLLLFGGDTKGHSDAQDDAWRRILLFLKKHLEDGITERTRSNDERSKL